MSYKKWGSEEGDTAAVCNSLRIVGYLGLHTLTWHWPGFIILHYSGVEPFEWPPLGQFASLRLPHPVTRSLPHPLDQHSLLKYVRAENAAGSILMRLLYGRKYATLYTGLCIVCIIQKSKGRSVWGKRQKNRLLKRCRMGLRMQKYSAGIRRFSKCILNVN